MDTKPPYTDFDSGLLDCLTLYSQRHDLAIGLPRPGARTMSLLDFRRQQEREATASLAGAMFYKTVIDECHKEVKQMIDGADTPEARREILPQVERLNALAKQSAVELEKMIYGSE